MKKIFILCLALFFACGILLCFAEDAKQPAVIEVQAGREFTITLESNATTGYSWQFSKPLDKEMLELIITGHSVDRPLLVGSGGKQMWTIKALKPGKTVVLLEYVRPWEKGIPPVKEESFTIIIKK